MTEENVNCNTLLGLDLGANCPLSLLVILFKMLIYFFLSNSASIYLCKGKNRYKYKVLAIRMSTTKLF